MATQVYMPQKQQQGGMGVLPLIGAGVGAVYGGPAGAGLGMGVGNAVQGVTQQNQQVAEQPPVQSNSGESEATVQNAVQRRQQQLQNIGALQDAQVVAQKDPQLNKQFGPALDTALQRARMASQTA